MMNLRDDNGLWSRLHYMPAKFLMEFSNISTHTCDTIAQFRFLKIKMDTEGGLYSRQH